MSISAAAPLTPAILAFMMKQTTATDWQYMFRKIFCKKNSIGNDLTDNLWVKSAESIDAACENIETFDFKKGRSDFDACIAHFPEMAISAVTQFLAHFVHVVRRRMFENKIPNAFFPFVAHVAASVESHKDKIAPSTYAIFSRHVILASIKGLDIPAVVAIKHATDFASKISTVFHKDMAAAGISSINHYPPLGDGLSAEVFLAHSRSDNKQYAVKKFSDFYNHEGIFLFAHYLAEVEALTAMEQGAHAYAVKFYGVLMCGSRLSLVLEYASNGNLIDYAEKDLAAYNLWLPTLPLKLFSALYYLHLNRFVHRDIKPDNILIMANGDIRLGDFGALVDASVLKLSTKSLAGTRSFTPPETLYFRFSEQDRFLLKRLGLQENDLYVSPALDIWAAGVTLWMAFSECVYAFKGRQVSLNYDELETDEIKALAHTANGEGFPYPITNENKLNAPEQAAVKQVVLKSWNISPSDRITADDALKTLGASPQISMKHK